MKATGLVLGAVLAAGAGYTIKAGCFSSERAPDVRLANHFDKMMCGIARDNVNNPERGVRKLGHYLDKHARDMFGDFGDMLATIERIRDDDKHDRRAEKARDRLRKAVIACARDWNRFGEAVGNDPKAVELLENFNERLGRTFEIIFGDGRQFDLLQLPEQMVGTFAPR
ncbi:MAG TPA: hypothetical protein VIV11_09945 [Kofleriaceae bacterium]